MVIVTLAWEDSFPFTGNSFIVSRYNDRVLGCYIHLYCPFIHLIFLSSIFPVCWDYKTNKANIVLVFRELLVRLVFSFFNQRNSDAYQESAGGSAGGERCTAGGGEENSESVEPEVETWPSLLSF